MIFWGGGGVIKRSFWITGGGGGGLLGAKKESHDSLTLPYHFTNCMTPILLSPLLHIEYRCIANIETMQFIVIILPLYSAFSSWEDILHISLALRISSRIEKKVSVKFCQLLSDMITSVTPSCPHNTCNATYTRVIVVLTLISWHCNDTNITTHLMRIHTNIIPVIYCQAHTRLKLQLNIFKPYQTTTHFNTIISEHLNK